MLKKIAFLWVLIFSQTLYAQVVIGLSGTYEHPVAKFMGVNPIVPGAELNIGYLFFEEKIEAGVVWRFSRQFNLAENPSLSAYSTKLRYFFNSHSRNRFYGSGEFGYYHTKEILKFWDGSTMTIPETGVVASSGIGFVSASHIIPRAYLDLSISFRHYNNPNRPGSLSLSAGIRFKI